MIDHHRTALIKALDKLDDDRRKYGLKILAYVEKEKRFEMRHVLAFLVLEGCMTTVSIDLEAMTFTERLDHYLSDHGHRLSQLLYSPDFFSNRTGTLHQMAVAFEADIAGLVLKLLEDGILKPKEKRVFRFTADESTAPAVFPFEDEDNMPPELDDELPPLSVLPKPDK